MGMPVSVVCPQNICIGFLMYPGWDLSVSVYNLEFSVGGGGGGGLFLFYSDGLVWLEISAVFLFMLFFDCKSSLHIRCSFMFSTVPLIAFLL